MGIVKKKVYRRKDKLVPKSTLTISDQEALDLSHQLTADADWLLDLSETEEMSQEWLLKCSKELLLQCMGKKSIIHGDKVVNLFRERSALRFIELIAQLKGYLVVEKGKIIFNQQFINSQQLEDQPITKSVELEISDDRTGEVLRILQESGAMQPTPEKSIEVGSIEILSPHPHC